MADFSKEAHIYASLQGKAKKEHLLYSILFSVFYIWAAFLTFESLYDICNMVGAVVSGTPVQAIVQLKRMLPILLTAIAVISLGIRTHSNEYAEDEEKRINGWKKGGYASIIFGALIALYILIGLLTGQYEHFVEGFVSKLFPLDILLGGVLLIGIGLLFIRYAKKLSDEGSELPAVPRISWRLTQFFNRIFYTLTYLVSVYSFAACVHGVYVMDWSHGNIFFNVMLWLNFFVAFAMIWFYRFAYADLKPEYKKAAATRFGGWVLLINLVLFGAYLVAVETENEAPNLNAFGILPVEFTASFNAFLPIYALNNICAPFAAFLKGLLRRAEK